MCGRESALSYRSIAAYTAAQAAGEVRCPHCGAGEMTRLIRSVRVGGAKAIDYTGMSAEQMRGVLEGGRADEVNTMVRQVSDTAKNTP
jgi:hypothetical protein